MSTALARKFRVDVTTDLTLAAGWLELVGMNDFSFTDTPNLEDASAYDTNGSASFEKTFEEWAAKATCMRRLTGGVYDVGQELVRGRSFGQFGDNCRVGFRWYDKNGGPEAYQGVAIVGWERSTTGVKNLDSVAMTFTGTDIPLAPITNPGTAPTAPLIVSALPSAVAVGGLVTVTGAAFIGTTGVTVGGVAVGSGNFSIVSDGTLVIKIPAGSAGSAPIIVTNAVGASAAFPYTRGA